MRPGAFRDAPGLSNDANLPKNLEHVAAPIDQTQHVVQVTVRCSAAIQDTIISTQIYVAFPTLPSDAHESQSGAYIAET